MRIGSLSHVEAGFYHAQGYFRLPDVYSESETAGMRAMVLEQAQCQAAQRQAIGGALLKMYGLYRLAPDIVGRAIRHPKLVGALTSLLGPHVVMVTNRHNHATVNDRQGAPREGLHRDILQPTRGLLTAAVYLDDSTHENGATRVIPGSHMLPNMGAPQPNGGGTWLAEHEEFDGFEKQAVTVPVAAGGVLLFNGMLFHGVGANENGQSRMSMTFGFSSADELDFCPDDERQVLVAGEHIYRGNDTLAS